MFTILFPTDEMSVTTNRITGEIDFNTQYHFAMELMMARVTPIEDGYDAFVTTQHVDLAQNAIALVLDVPANRYVREVFYCIQKI